MNMPQGLNGFLLTSESKEMETVAAPPILRILRPATFGLWFIIFAASLQTVVVTGDLSNILVLVLANDKNIMGKWVNNRFSNYLGYALTGIIFLATIALLVGEFLPAA